MGSAVGAFYVVRKFGVEKIHKKFPRRIRATDKDDCFWRISREKFSRLAPVQRNRLDSGYAMFSMVGDWIPGGDLFARGSDEGGDVAISVFATGNGGWAL